MPKPKLKANTLKLQVAIPAAELNRRLIGLAADSMRGLFL
jgi:hypothetical protein